MTELKPCPFCGGEAAYSSERGQVICKEPTCRGWLQPNCWVYLSKQNAISHWNRRAERTCHHKDGAFGIETECGARYDVWAEGAWSYCPNCGAKVMNGGV